MAFPTPKGYNSTQFNNPTEAKPEPETETEAEPDTDTQPKPEPHFSDKFNHKDLKSAIEEYQDWCNQHYDVLDVDLDGIPVEISDRMTKTAGKVSYIKGTDEIKYIRYAYKAYQKWGWEKFAETIRHELIHVHTVQNYQKGGHGRLFKMLVDPLDTHRHCESFTKDEAKYILRCTDCGNDVGHRHRESKIVKKPQKYRSKCCSSPITVINT